MQQRIERSAAQRSSKQHSAPLLHVSPAPRFQLRSRSAWLPRIQQKMTRGSLHDSHTQLPHPHLIAKCAGRRTTTVHTELQEPSRIAAHLHLVADLNSDLLDCLKVSGRGDREARLNDINAQLRQLHLAVHCDSGFPPLCANTPHTLQRCTVNARTLPSSSPAPHFQLRLRSA